MAIKINGVPCLTGYEEAQAELDRFGYLWDFVWGPDQGALHYGHQPPPVAWWRTAPAAAPLHARRCRPPRWALNSLWIPTGAARYSIGLFLATGKATDEILTGCGAMGDAALELTATGSVHDKRSTLTIATPRMYCLPPVALSNARYDDSGGNTPTDKGDEDLFLIPLVDVRFFWQFRSVNFGSTPDDWTWSAAEEAITEAIDGLGTLTWGTNVFSTYRPDWFALGAKSAIAGLFADAVAASTGRRIRVQYAPDATTFIADSLAESIANDVTRSDNTVIGQDLLAQIQGDKVYSPTYTPALPPARARVFFDRRQGGYHEQRGHQRIESVDVATAIAALPEGVRKGRALADWELDVHTTAQADYSLAGVLAGGHGSASPGLAPDNAADCTYLAELIAQQAVGWGLEQWDFCALPDIGHGFEQSARDDYVWVIIDMPIATAAAAFDFPKTEPLDTWGEQISFVRAKSIGFHDAAALEWCLQFAPSAAPLPRMATGICRVELTEALKRSGDAAAYVYHFDESTRDWIKDTRYTVKVFDSLERFSGVATDRFWACALPHDSGRFEIVSPASDAILAWAYLSHDLCDTTTTIHVHHARRYPDCKHLHITSVANPYEHRGRTGARVFLVRRDCVDSSSGAGSGSGSGVAAVETWDIVDIEKRIACAVMKVEDRTTCLVAVHHKFAAEWSPDHDPTAACLIIDINPCSTPGSSGAGSSGAGGCDLTWSTVDWACCGTFAACAAGSGGGSGG